MKPQKHSPVAFAAATVTGLLFAAGCAVMTVDVDVYKGALNNDPDVQLQQLSSMAAGALPLLKELRNSLVDTNTVHVDLTQNLIFEDLGPNATSVQDILSLYFDKSELDQTPPKLREIEQRISNAISQYRSAYSLLFHSENQPGASNVIASLAKQTNSSLAQAYKSLIKGETHTYPSYEIVKNTPAEHAPPALEGNAIFEWLPSEAPRAADLLLSDPQERLTFIALINRISQGFIGVRTALEHNLVSIFDLAEYMNQHQKFLRDVDSFNDKTIQYIVLLIRPLHIAIAQIEGQLNLPDSTQFQQTLNGLNRIDVQNKELNIAVTNFLRIEFQKYPIMTVQALRRAHSWIQTAKLSLDPRRFDPKLNITSSLEFGLARGPTLDEQELRPEVVENLWRSEVASQLVFGGLERGRLDAGLFRTTEDFYQLLQTNRLSDASKAARGTLLDELSRFATKVLFLANNKALIGFDNSKQTETLIRGLQAIGNSILVECDEIAKQFAYKTDLIDGTTSERMALSSIHGSTYEVLDMLRAAVDSSTNAPEIKTQALEKIKKLQADKDSLNEPSFDDLFTKVTAGASPELTKMFTGIQEDLRGVLFFGPRFRNRKEVLDHYIAKLEYAYLSEIQKNGMSATSSNVVAVLTAAYEYRTGLIYIRPASAYLRSSYPATALQDGTRFGWRNMLSDQNNRSMNIFNFQSSETKLNVRLASEIDKISWQRINEVRVAGGGKTTYVLAKDDVGNWYIKSFDAEVTNIINSMKNLASFSLKTAIPSTTTQLAKAGKLSSPTTTNLSALAVAYTNLDRLATSEMKGAWTNLLVGIDSVTNTLAASKAQSQSISNALLILTQFKSDHQKTQISSIVSATTNLDAGFHAIYRALVKLRLDDQNIEASNAVVTLASTLKSLGTQRERTAQKLQTGMSTLAGGL